MGQNAISSVIRNDSLTLKATVTDPITGAAVSLDGWKAYCTIKSALNETTNTNDDASAAAQVIVDNISDPNGTGVVLFQFVPSKTNILPGDYVYDVQFITGTNQIYSSTQDDLTITADVTRATS